MATCRPGDTLLLARNSHMCAITGLAMSGARPYYVRPEVHLDDAVAHAVTDTELELGFKNAKKLGHNVKAVLVTSLTYYGACSDLRALQKVCEAHGAMLLVDEAHGPHLSLLRASGGGLAAGAALVAQSTHKTLGSLTQSAMLHVGKGAQGKLDVARLRRALQTVQSSSPSYPLMASLDAARARLAAPGGRAALFGAAAAAAHVRSELADIEWVDVWGSRGDDRVAYAWDPLRLTVGVRGLTGQALATLLLDEFEVEVELVSPNAVVLVFGVGSTSENAELALEAITEIADAMADEAEDEEEDAQAEMEAEKDEDRAKQMQRLAREAQRVSAEGDAVTGLTADEIWAEVEDVDEDVDLEDGVGEGGDKGEEKEEGMAEARKGLGAQTAKVNEKTGPASSSSWGKLMAGAGGEEAEVEGTWEALFDVIENEEQKGQDEASTTTVTHRPGTGSNGVTTNKTVASAQSSTATKSKTTPWNSLPGPEKATHDGDDTEYDNDQDIEDGERDDTEDAWHHVRTLANVWLQEDDANARVALLPRAAWDAETERVPLAEAVGRVSAELLCPYPPGIPVVCPGERMDETALNLLLAVRDAGGRITGASDGNLETVVVVAESRGKGALSFTKGT